MSTRLGLIVMAVLTACCNKVSAQAVTDRTWDYVQLTRRIPRLSSPRSGPHLLRGRLTQPLLEDRLMRASYEIIDLSGVSIDRLLKLREKEDSQFNELRHGYVRFLRDFIWIRSNGRDSVRAHDIEANFIKQGRRWVRDLENILEAKNKGRRLIEVSMLGVAGLAVKRFTTSSAESAVELLSRSPRWRATRYSVRKEVEAERRRSPVGYLHFLSQRVSRTRAR